MNKTSATQRLLESRRFGREYSAGTSDGASLNDVSSIRSPKVSLRIRTPRVIISEKRRDSSRRSTIHATREELRRNAMKATAAKGKPLTKKVENDKSTETSESQQVDEGDEDDPCLNRNKEGKRATTEDDKTKRKFRGTPGLDPRFQQQNQTIRCYVMYTDFYRCEKILGEGHEACTWFRDVFTSVCPTEWVARWDDLRAEGRFAWPRGMPLGHSPDDRYGV